MSLFGDFSAELKENSSEQAGILIGRLEQYTGEEYEEATSTHEAHDCEDVSSLAGAELKTWLKNALHEAAAELGPSSQGSTSKQHLCLQWIAMKEATLQSLCLPKWPSTELT